jgi:hypothetical protein
LAFLERKKFGQIDRVALHCDSSAKEKGDTLKRIA